ncbi:MAG: peptide-methionine (S)-S-oxide reductase MsrA, partial [Alphaproteobacteria bacterium]|nr:peptide-methionine (S)-S-oxide reductase MsrA [Alphaproteobacteria bacterium]
METALFGAGCFWGVEAAFRQVGGVRETAVGYAGGSVANPTYEDVCSGATGHAEVVRVLFDPAQVSYRELLDAFWAMHDPTSRDRQGPDVGPQYRSAIFTADAEQERVARDSLAGAGPRIARPIVTEITPAGFFFLAEDYHQQYF